MNLNPQDFLVHDISQHPMVVFRNNAARPGYAKQWEVETASLIRHGVPFVIVYDQLRGDEDHEDRKHRALWLKQNKAEMNRVCKGFISIEPDPVRREEVRQMGLMLARAFGMQHEAVESQAEARTLAQRLASERSSGK
ncbi:hypothetical protein [Bordetella pseudohinzii]|uniref:Uncharacterized protein n=1 Tax=Bordetella pseudohinzii TaxID=1331258 RepID=A0A0J6CDJ5_9BORD|nr:hypothetical protein [Bordetella pseudohinzii]ANY16551.1 hypothetical protein BBN53_11980 [Bordetella pseudohinzii]KMM27702.1 hypothetical protein L540_01500 [Bordetella pseudohinzii]KXA81484.1 hypothetical protein AW877_03830 [Bordetella pseudohinzii]KXA82156.1 hypothetical protein AW878_02595 [Bordetella pseudohinzii]CUI33055.1 Uncharacterised protein [Bordetella pseudohinzii]